MTSELETIIIHIDKGFDRIEKRLADDQKEYKAHIASCYSRFNTLESWKIQRQAEIASAHVRDYWPYFWKAMIGLLCASALTLIWRVVQHIRTG